MCDAALVGGVYLACTPNNMIAFARIGAISPSDACRPFDERADGFVLGEGTGCLLLKRLDDAVRDGDRIWAVVRGVGINNDGRGEGPMTPRLEGQVAALEQAYADAGLSPAEVGLVEAHGTATRVGDRVESTSLAHVFGAARRGIGGLDPCRITSIKGNVGHTLAAAGAAGVINAALALGHRRIPPLAGYERARGDLPLGDAGLEIAGEAREWIAERRVAAVSSFGFGGTNVHVVLEEAPARHRPRWSVTVRDEATELFLVSAPNPALLARAAAELAAWVRESDAPLADVAFTLARRRLDAARAAIVARGRDELVARLEQVASGVEGEGVHVFTGAEPVAAEEIAFLFPGQGAQAPDLCRDLWDHLPAYRERLVELAGRAEGIGRRFLDLLYPDPAERDRAAAELTRTEVCQPALAAVELALVDLLRACGVEAGVLVGHSLGEFVAAAAGGVLGAGDAVALVAERGRLMAELDGDHGAMAALATDRESAARLILGVDGAVLANFNHPRQVVVSGTSAAIDQAVAAAGAAGVRATRLPVSHGFHSPIVAAMAARFGRVLDAAEWSPPARAVISCASDGDLRPGVFESEPDAIRARLARHALAAIDFESGVRAAWKAGARVFVQVGGGSTLLAMVNATLAADGCAPRLAVSLAPADGAPVAGLATALARLVGLGLPIDVGALFHGRGTALTALPVTPLATRPFWILRAPADPPALPALDAVRGTRNQAGRVGVSGREAPEGRPMSEPDAAAHGIVELFQRQLQVMHSQIEVLRERGLEVPAAESAPRPARSAELAVAPGPAARVPGDTERQERARVASCRGSRRQGGPRRHREAGPRDRLAGERATARRPVSDRAPDRRPRARLADDGRAGRRHPGGVRPARGCRTA